MSNKYSIEHNVKMFDIKHQLKPDIIEEIYLPEKMGSSGYTCIRRTFCWLNILVWLCGCAFLGAGLWLRLAYQGYATLLPDHAGLSADSLFITAGVLSFIVAFFGCCGSWFQSKCLLITYFILVVLLFLSEFLLGSLAFVFRGGIGRTLSSELKDGIIKHYNASDLGGRVTPSVAAIWDKLQINMHCCGVSSYEDWYDIQSWPGERWVPTSCCRPFYNRSFDIVFEGSGNTDSGLSIAAVDCGKSMNPQLWWDKGCNESFQMWLVQRLHIVGSIGLVIAFLQLFGLITSMLLFCTMKHKTSSHTYKSYSPTIEPNHRLRTTTSNSNYLDD